MSFERTTGRARFSLAFTARQQRVIAFTGILVGTASPAGITIEIAHPCP